MVDCTDKIAVHCGHCGGGIPYDKRYFHCLHCKVRFCNHCHGRHPQDHVPFCKRQVSRSTPYGLPLMDGDCVACMKTMHTGYQCKECEYRLCINCHPESDLLKDHEHKLLVFIHPPGEFAVESVHPSCSTCKTSSSMIHCGRCLQGIKEGQKAHECVTCLKKYEAATVVCDDCLPLSISEHDKSHIFASVLYRLDMNISETHFSLRCIECAKEFEHCDTLTIPKHPHRSFEMIMGRREMEDMGYRSYRLCVKKAPVPIQDARRNAEAQRNCLCCRRVCKWDEDNWYCLTCDNFACNQCKSAGVLNHPHELEKCAFKENPAPDDFYKTVVENPQVTCNSCEDSFFTNCARYLHCRGCDDYDYCVKCLAAKLPLVEHRSCSMNAGWDFRWSPASQYNNLEWCNDQMEKSKEYSEKLQPCIAAEQESQRLEEEFRRLQQENRDLQAKSEALRQENIRMQQQQQQQQAQQQLQVQQQLQLQQQQQAQQQLQVQQQLQLQQQQQQQQQRQLQLQQQPQQQPQLQLQQQPQMQLQPQQPQQLQQQQRQAPQASIIYPAQPQQGMNIAATQQRPAFNKTRVNTAPAAAPATQSHASNAQKQQDKARRDKLIGKVAVSTISAFTKMAIGDYNSGWQN